MKNKCFNEEKIIMKKVNQILYNKYGDSINNYNKQKIYILINGINSNYNTNFKDYVFDNFEEYHKRFYHKDECIIKLEQFFIYYLNYLTFFCRPVFHNFYFNNLLQYFYDLKADIFYQENYKNNKNDEDEDNKKEESNYNLNKYNSRDNINLDNFILKGKINIIFDTMTRNKIDNSSNVMSSIEKIYDDEDENISFKQKLKINDKDYITLRDNKDNLIDFLREINFKEKTKNNPNLKNDDKRTGNNHSSSPINKNYLSGEINIKHKNKKHKKTDSFKDKIKYIKLIKSDKKNKSGIKIKQNIKNTKEPESFNILKNSKTVKKLDINFNNLKSNIYKFYKIDKIDSINFKLKGMKINKSNKNIDLSNNTNNTNNINKKSKKIINEKRLSFNNINKYKPKIIENKKNSLINTSNYAGNKISIANNKSMKIKTININNIINSNLPTGIKKNQSILFYKNDKKNNTLIYQNSQNIHCGRNTRKHSMNSTPFNAKSKNNNLLKAYLNNCLNLKKLSTSKSMLKEKTKTICQSIDQMKTFSVRLIKSFSKKSIYHGKSLGCINNKNINNTSNNISINDKTKKSSKNILKKKSIKNKKSNSNSIIKGKGELIYPKKNSINPITSSNEVKLNVNLNLHNIFININSSTNNHQNYNNHNNNSSINNFNKKVVVNNNLYDNYNVIGKSMKTKKNKKKINNDSYKNKTESYKSRNKTQNKIKKNKYDSNNNIKGKNSFIFTNSNMYNKQIKQEKNKTIKKNIIYNKSHITLKESNKASLSLNKKSHLSKNKSIDEKSLIYKIILNKKK